MTLSHCRKNFCGDYSFYVEDKNYMHKKIEFGFCPVCKKAILKEIKIDFKQNKTERILKGYEAEIYFNKALFNRLVYISKLKYGTHARQYWCFGDYKKTNKKDDRGNLIHMQIKRNFNGQEMENFGLSKVKYC